MHVTQENLIYILRCYMPVTPQISVNFDAETQQALIQFQTACGLTPDGVINQQVITVLGITV